MANAAKLKRKRKRKLDSSDIATILAALRLFQRTYEDTHGDDIRKAWEHFAEAEPLGSEDIDRLCEEINFGEVRL